MQYLHTMIRVSDVEASLRFFCDGLGLKEISRFDSEPGRFTLIFLATDEDIARSGYKGGKIPDGVWPINEPEIKKMKLDSHVFPLFPTNPGTNGWAPYATIR